MCSLVSELAVSFLTDPQSQSAFCPADSTLGYPKSITCSASARAWIVPVLAKSSDNRIHHNVTELPCLDSAAGENFWGRE